MKKPDFLSTVVACIALLCSVSGSSARAIKAKTVAIASQPQPIVLKLDGISQLRVISLSWTIYKGKDFSFCNIYRDTCPGFKPGETNIVAQGEKSSDHRFIDDTLEQAALLKVILPGSSFDKVAPLPKTLYYKVVVYNSAGRKTVSNELAVALPAPSTTPPTPSVLALKSVSNSRATVEWTECKDPDVISYQLHRSQQSGFIPSHLTLVGLGSAAKFEAKDKGETKWEDKNLDAQTKYFYKLETFNIDGLSSESNELEVETSAPPQPRSAPAQVVLKLAAPPTFDTISLQWTKSNDPNFDSYELSQLEKPSDAPPKQATVGVFGATDTSWIDEELPEGTTCYYVILVRNKFDQTTASNVVTVTTRQHAPRPVTLKAANDEGYSVIKIKPDGTQTATKVAPQLRVDLSWSGQRTEVSGSYTVYRSSKAHFKPEEASMLIKFGASEAGWDDRTVKSGQTYFYKIVYRANNGQTLTSNEAKVVVPVLVNKK